MPTHEHNPPITRPAETAKTGESNSRGIGGGSGMGGAGGAGKVAQSALIPNWRQGWRMLSIQVAGVAVIFGALPVDQQASILALLGVGPERIPAVLGLAVIAARLIAQPKANA